MGFDKPSFSRNFARLARLAQAHALPGTYTYAEGLHAELKGARRAAAP